MGLYFSSDLENFHLLLVRYFSVPLLLSPTASPFFSPPIAHVFSHLILCRRSLRLFRFFFSLSFFFFSYLCFTLNNSVSITLSSVLLFFDSVSFAIMYWINTFRCIFHLYKLHLVFLKTSSISLLRSCFLLKLSIWT